MHFTRTWLSCALALTSLLAQLVSIAQAQGSPEAQATVEDLGKSDPIAAAQKILEFPGIFDPDQSLWASDANITGTGDLQQVPWSRGAFSPGILGQLGLTRRAIYGYRKVQHV